MIETTHFDHAAKRNSFKVERRGSIVMVMRGTWQRANPPVELNLAQVEDILRTTPLGGRVTRATLVEGGLRNSTYKVETDRRASPVCLRIYQTGHVTAETERDVLSILPTGALAPRLLAWNPASFTKYPFAVFEWSSGTPLISLLPHLDSENIRSTGYRVGRALAALHRVKFDRPGVLGPGPDVVRRLGTNGADLVEFAETSLVVKGAAWRVGADFSSRLSSWIRANASLLDSSTSTSCLLHGDFGPSNILVVPKGDGEISIIDWEFAFSGAPAFDFGNLLRPPLGGIAGFAEHVANGYVDAGGQLDAEWQRRAQLADCFALLEIISRTGVEPARIVSIKAHLKHVMTLI